jgi:hypothetical protein
MKTAKWIIYGILGLATLALFAVSPFLLFSGAIGGADAGPSVEEGIFETLGVPWILLTLLWFAAIGLFTLWKVGGQE